MIQSPFAFYRGAAAIMAADLGNTLTSGIVVQACGDCHIMNFRGFATPERRIIFDINGSMRLSQLPGNGISNGWQPVLQSRDTITDSIKKRHATGHYAVYKVIVNTCKPMPI
jgi:hypothetical protein